MEESQKPLGKPVHKGLIATIGAGVIWLGGELAKEAGKSFGEWIGPTLLDPTLFVFTVIAGISWWIASRTLKAELKQFAFLVGLIIGQTAPMVLVFYLYGSTGMRALGFDFLVLVVGLIWLIRRPSLAPVIILIAYESLTLLLVIQQTFVGTSSAAPGVAAIVFKVATVVTLLFAFQAIMKKRAALTTPKKTT